MTRVPLHHLSNYFISDSDREFYLSEYVSWLILNVGEKNKDWWFNRHYVSGAALSFAIVKAEDATAFRLKFGI